MALRILPRTVLSSAPKRFVAVYQSRRYSFADSAKNNPTSSAEQALTSPPLSRKEVPLTIDSHGPVTQNPKHTKKVIYSLYMLIAVIFIPD